jgi:hypothetical protein
MQEVNFEERRAGPWEGEIEGGKRGKEINEMKNKKERKKDMKISKT